MIYFKKEERNLLEEKILGFVANQNDIPTLSEKYGLTNVMQELIRHGISSSRYFQDELIKGVMKVCFSMNKNEIPINIDSFKSFIERAGMINERRQQLFQKFFDKATTGYEYHPLYFQNYIQQFKEHLLMDYWLHVFKMHENNEWGSLDVVDNSFRIVDGFNDLWSRLTINIATQDNESIKSELEERVKNNREGISTSVKTGLQEWDDFTGGFENSELYLLAGRPSMGKTTVAIAFIKRMIYNSKKVHFFTLEMTRSQIINKFVAEDIGVTYSDLKRGNLTDEKLKEAMDRYDIYETHPYLVVDELETQTLSELYEKMKSVDADIRIIDYLQLIRLDKDLLKKAGNREQEVGEVSKSLKRFAKELKNPVVALSQLSRAVESRTVKRPMLSDLRESGSLEQDADVIIFVYRDAYYEMQRGIPVSKERQGNVELIIAKGREIGLRDFKFWVDLENPKMEEGHK